MIISASYRTDIPAFYSDWFCNRLDEGFVEVKNPFNNKVGRISLLPADVTAFVFWTRNPIPFLPTLDRLAKTNLPFYIQFTHTAYPNALEPSVPELAQLLPSLAHIRNTYGAHSLVWRYDPVFISDLTPEHWHRDNFSRLADAMEDLTTEVCLSFTQIYKKTARNCDQAALKHGFNWRDPSDGEKQGVLNHLASLAIGRGLTPTLCSQPEFETTTLNGASCIDIARLETISRKPLKAKRRGNRPGCLCAESRDIGTYDSCPHGCCYCYANRTPEAAKTFLKRHDPRGSLL